MKSIKTKILVSMITFALVGAIIIGALSAVCNYLGTLSLLRSTMTPAADIASTTIQEAIDTYWQTLTEAAALDVYHTSAPNDPALIERSAGIASRNGFLRIAKADANGNSSTGENVSSEAFFQQCKSESRTTISDIALSDRDGLMVFTLAAPILTDSRFDGVVYGVVDAAFLNNIVSELRMGETGEAYILDQTGTVIASVDNELVLNQTNIIEQAKTDPSLRALAALHQQMVDGQDGFGSYTYDGKKKLLGHSPIPGDQGWSIAVAVEQSEFLSSLNLSLTLTAITVVAVITAAVFIAFRLANGVTRPIRQCVTRLEQLSEGDLQTPVPQPSGKDETSLLLKALDVTVTRLGGVVQDVSHHLSEMADGNFDTTSTRQYRGDFIAIQNSLVNINQSLSDTIYGIRQAADQVAAGSDQVASGAQALAQGATEQASSVEELSATVNDISSAAQRNAQTATSARLLANDAGGAIEQSNAQMQEMLGAMGDISRSSNEISKIIKTIEDIAFQTNILALNAAVEAARAGSAGKGFAVVADEVRNLASKSAEASKNTAALIEQSIRAVERGTSLAGDTAGALKTASEKAHEAVSQIDLIAEAVNQEAASIEQITVGIDQISAVVQTNSATSEESAAASEELSSQSQLVRQLVSRFRLQDNAVQNNVPMPHDMAAAEPDFAPYSGNLGEMKY